MSTARRRPIPRVHRVAAPLLASAVLVAAAPVSGLQPAGAQPAAGVPGAGVPGAGVPGAGDAVAPVTLPPAPAVLPPTAGAEYFLTPRDLRGCPFRTTPPPAVDESEALRPGQERPTPPSVPGTPVGGEQLAGCDVAAPAGFTVPKEVTASGWVVSDLDTGEVVAAKDPHGRYRPASTIKTLLASVVLDELSPDELITVTPEDLEGTEGSAVGVGPGGKYTVDRLLHGLLMMSGNDAAFVLAHHLGGVDATLEKMNAHARALGCTDTHVTSVNGLDKPGMSTSAYDMSLIFRDAMTRGEFRDIVHTQTWGFPGYPAGDDAGAPDPENPPQTVPQPTVRPDGTTVNPGFVIYNDNKLLFEYPGALGGKTGFTDDARHTYIGAAERDGRRLAAVILDATREPRAPWQQAAMLLDSGFAAKDARPVGSLVAAPSSTPQERTGSGPGALPFGDDVDSGDSSGFARRYGPWAALGAAAVVVLAGAVVALRRPRGGAGNSGRGGRGGSH